MIEVELCGRWLRVLVRFLVRCVGLILDWWMIWCRFEFGNWRIWWN